VTDRRRSSLLDPDGSINVAQARIRCVSLARGMVEGIALVDAFLADPLNLEKRLLLTAWSSSQRIRFDL
jgi:hypothetical protein